jgi:hypothetical protein
MRVGQTLDLVGDTASAPTGAAGDGHPRQGSYQELRVRAPGNQ